MGMKNMKRCDLLRVFALIGWVSGFLVLLVAGISTTTTAHAASGKDAGKEKEENQQKPVSLPPSSGAPVPTLDSIIYDRKDFSDVNAAKPLLKLHYQGLSGSLGRSSTKPGGK